MKQGRKILITMMMGCWLSGSVFAQYNSSTTPRGNTGASHAIKKSPLLNKKTSTETKTTPAVTTTTTTPKNQVAKKAASPVNSTKTATVKKPTPAKTAVVEPVATTTVSPSKKETHHGDVRDYDYRNAIGIRAGQTSGITFKHFLSSHEAVEGIFGLWPNAIGITGLYEKYVPSENVDGLSWYFGGGGHMSFSTGRLYYVYHENRYYSYRNTYPGFGAGIDGIVGAEYKLPSVPLAISFDIKPFIEVNRSGVIFTAFDPGLGIKFTLK